MIGGGVPSDQKTLTIDDLEGKKGAVTFAHGKHATDYRVDGKAISCKTCHHTLAADAPAAGVKVKACTACHVKEGQAKKSHAGKEAPFLATGGAKIDKKSILYHQNCVDGCHKKAKSSEGKKLKSCKVCHP